VIFSDYEKSPYVNQAIDKENRGLREYEGYHKLTFREVLRRVSGKPEVTIFLIQILVAKTQILISVDRELPETDGFGNIRMVKGLLKANQDYRVVNAAIPDYIHWTTDELGIVSVIYFLLKDFNLSLYCFNLFR
jgi:hypothetical protein